MARASDAMRWLAAGETKIAGVHSGIAPATVRSYGYHNSRKRHLAGVTAYGRRDYSVQKPADKRGDEELFSAIDWSHTRSNMIKYTKRLVAAADRRDPRMRYLREFYGTTNGSTVVGRIHDAPDGPWKSSTADLSHLSHIHKSLFRQYAGSRTAMEAVLSVERGESLAAYQSRTGGASGAAVPVPSGEPLLRRGSAIADVRLLQAALNDALGSNLAKDGDFGPATEAAVKMLQQRTGLAVDGIYGPATAAELTDLLEDDMQLNDTVDMYDEKGRKRWWSGHLIGKDKISVNSALQYAAASLYYTRDEVVTRLKAAEKRDKAILDAVQGLDTQAILARIDQRAQEDAARDRAMLELLDQHASGSLDAEAVVQRIGQLLAGAQSDGS